MDHQQALIVHGLDALDDLWTEFLRLQHGRIHAPNMPPADDLSESFVKAIQPLMPPGQLIVSAELWAAHRELAGPSPRSFTRFVAPPASFRAAHDPSQARSRAARSAEPRRASAPVSHTAIASRGLLRREAPPQQQRRSQCPNPSPATRRARSGPGAAVFAGENPRPPASPVRRAAPAHCAERPRPDPRCRAATPARPESGTFPNRYSALR